MDVVLVMFKDKQRREFPLQGERTVLGRRQDCDLRVPTKDVSRQHCAVEVEGDKLVVKDLGSANGTFVNGKRVAEQALKPGDRVRVGPVTFVVQIEGKPAEISPKDLAASAAAPAKGDEAGEEEKTFDLSEEEDFDLSDIEFDEEDAITELEEISDDEEDMP